MFTMLTNNSLSVDLSNTKVYIIHRLVFQSLMVIIMLMEEKVIFLIEVIMTLDPLKTIGPFT